MVYWQKIGDEPWQLTEQESNFGNLRGLYDPGHVT